MDRNKSQRGQSPRGLGLSPAAGMPKLVIDESLIANSVGSALEWDSANKLINVRVDGSTILVDATNNWLKAVSYTHLTLPTN